MRILQFITSLRPGGAERLVTDLALHFKEEGHEVSVLLLDGTRTLFFDELEGAGIEVTALSKGFRSMRNPLLLFRLVRFLRAGCFDIVHTHNSSCQFLAAVASLFVRARLVTTEHNTSNRRREWRWFKPLDRWMYSRYSKVICVGEETRSRLVAHLGPTVSGKARVIGNGIDLKRFREAAPNPEIAGEEAFKIMMVAAFRAQKDQETLIRAMSSLPDDCRLFLVGGVELPEDEPNMERCRSIARYLGVDSRVRFLGKRGDVPSLLAASDVVVLSTHYEGMSLSVIEGMASGKPFLASDVSGVRDQVEGAGLLFPDGNPEALAGLIRRLRESPELSRETAAGCLERASGFDLHLTVLRYLEEYESIFQIL